MTSLLSSKTITGTFTTTSNYAGNSSVQRELMYEQILGSGVQKRPGWRKLSMPAKLAPLSYDKAWEVRNDVRWSYDHTERSGSTFLYKYERGPWGTPPNVSASVFSDCLPEADYKAKVKLFNQLSGEGANIANMFAERQQTIDFVANTTRKVALALRDFKRLDIARAFRRIFGDKEARRRLRGKDIADAWIALQYGLIPLMGDVYDVCNLSFSRVNSVQPMVFRASAKHRKFGKSDQSAAFFRGVNYGYRTTTAVAKYMIRAYPDRLLSTPASLGLTNPLVPLWEILPWSFVIDWFLPVGRFLEQLSATHGWTFHDGCYSSLVKSSETASAKVVVDYTSGSWTYTNHWDWEWNCKGDYFRRTTLSGFPSVSLPHFKNPLSLAHWYNAIALLVQQRK